MAMQLLHTTFHAKVDARRIFWHAFTAWLATASDEEFDQLEAVLAPHAHYVRPLQLALADCLSAPGNTARLPPRLHALLHAGGWPPALALNLPGTFSFPAVA